MAPYGKSKYFTSSLEYSSRALNTQVSEFPCVCPWQGDTLKADGLYMMYFYKVLILSACHANEWQPCKSTTNNHQKKKNQEKILNFVCKF